VNPREGWRPGTDEDKVIDLERGYREKLRADFSTEEPDTADVVQLFPREQPPDPDAMSAWYVRSAAACPDCGAAVGYKCGRSGGRRGSNHTARVRLARDRLVKRAR